MQRFHDTPTQNTGTTPVYDSETVRDVLARAAQIEQETQTDAPMTAEQIETLGRELGMSPESVRRSLQEKMAMQLSPAQLAEQSTLQPAQEAVRRAFVPLAWFGVLCFPVTFALCELERKIFPVVYSYTPSFLIVAMIIVAIVVFRLGFLVRQMRMAFLSAFYTPFTLIITNGAIFAVDGEPIDPGDNVITFLFFAVVGFIITASAIPVAKWWDNLPQNVAREAASHR